MVGLSRVLLTLQGVLRVYSVTIGEHASPNRGEDETDELGVRNCDLVIAIVVTIVELVDYGTG